MQVDPRTVASGGFMRNVCAVLLNFCEPFLDIRASKVSADKRGLRGVGTILTGRNLIPFSFYFLD